MARNCKLVAGASVMLMAAGTAFGSREIEAWALLVGIGAGCLGVVAAVCRGQEAVKAYIHRWTLETFEHGMKQGIELGREMEAADRMMAIVRKYRD